jgi:uncharacterized protein with ATP-grasp and redox domains
MQTSIDCFPCFLKQTVIAIRHYTGSDNNYGPLFKEVLSIMQDVDLTRPPAYTTTFIHRAIRENLGADPFREIKHDYNNKALTLYPRLREKVKTSKDPLWTATRLAIAGNVIDFGIYSSIDIDGAVERALRETIAVDDYERYVKDLESTNSVLYLLDNSGEIVFDKLLIEELVSRGKRIKAVVKGSPVLNDVTYGDALQTGLTDICSVIDNGSDAVGTILQWTSDEFNAEFRNAELIISKGQGNYETVSDSRNKTYFLFQSKCDVVSRELNLESGAMLLMGSKISESTEPFLDKDQLSKSPVLPEA